MFTKNATAPLKKVMCCPPTYLQLQPINEISRDWINQGENDSNRKQALAEWKEFTDAYRANGVEVVEVPADPNEPCPHIPGTSEGVRFLRRLLFRPCPVYLDSSIL